MIVEVRELLAPAGLKICKISEETMKAEILEMTRENPE